MLLVKDVINFLEEKFPPHLAYDWDNIGLQIGDVNQEISKVMVALDATTAVINEAINQDVDLIITHHPFIFSGLKQVDFTTPQGKNIQKVIKNDIAIYSMHTNYDIAFGGMNDILAKKLELQDVKPFAMIDDVHGLGRIGELTSDLSLVELSEKIKHQWLQEVVYELKTVDCGIGGRAKKIAVIGGSGGKYIHDAKVAGADVLVTGDVTYHTAVDAMEMGLNLVDVGHFAEVVMEEHIAGLLAERFDVEVVVQSVAKNPIRWEGSI